MRDTRSDQNVSATFPSSHFPVWMEHTRPANEYQSLRRVLIHGFRFLWRLRWPSLIHENDFAIWWQRGCISGWIPQKHCSSLPPHCSLRSVQSAASIGKVKYPVSLRHLSDRAEGWFLSHSSLVSAVHSRYVMSSPKSWHYSTSGRL